MFFGIHRLIPLGHPGSWFPNCTVKAINIHDHALLTNIIQVLILSSKTVIKYN